ncbi:hypothetical protein QHL1GM_12595 [Halomonas sp. QHL1]|nr:hypothetical protein QHL1GM_12595 [Halomonas sp. QHL1]
MVASGFQQILYLMGWYSRSLRLIGSVFIVFFPTVQILQQSLLQVLFFEYKLLLLMKTPYRILLLPLSEQSTFPSLAKPKHGHHVVP